MSAAKLSAWIDAGLDGCIGRPIEPSELIEAVNASLGREAAPQRRVVQPTPAQDPTEGPPIDMRVLRDLEKLGGEEFVESVVTQFIADASRILPELTASAETEDTSLFRDQIHALRSCAGNVGAVGLYKLCLASQTMAPHELVGDGGSYVARLKSEFERDISALGERGWRDDAPLAQVS
jgi:two-component system sensor histidine kinase RpfC